MRKVSVIAITVTYLDMTFATTANITSVVETGDYFVRTVICTIIWASFPMSHVDDMRGDGMDDLISRQAAIDAIKSRKTAEQSSAGIMRNAVVDFCIDIVKKLPSAQPEQRWIPCKCINQCYIPELENIPYRGMLFTYKTRTGKLLVRTTWIERGRLIGNKMNGLPIAYMPLPEPYREDIE